MIIVVQQIGMLHVYAMYDYCQLGWPTSIEDISALGIVVYPNPTSGYYNNRNKIRNRSRSL
jgi:hypothetical protein